MRSPPAVRGRPGRRAGRSRRSSRTTGTPPVRRCRSPSSQCSTKPSSGSALRCASGTATSVDRAAGLGDPGGHQHVQHAVLLEALVGRGPDRVVQPGRQLERDVARRARHQEGGQLALGREGLGCDAAGAVLGGLQGQRVADQVERGVEARSAAPPGRPNGAPDTAAGSSPSRSCRVSSQASAPHARWAVPRACSAARIGDVVDQGDPDVLVGGQQRHQLVDARGGAQERADRRRPGRLAVPRVLGQRDRHRAHCRAGTAPRRRRAPRATGRRGASPDPSERPAWQGGR